MKTTRQIVVISDTHCASTLGLCPPGGHRLDDGGRYQPSRLQRSVWKIWEEFWDDWVPRVTKGEPYDLVINGDAIDGDHHRTPTIISSNLHDQFRAAVDCLEPIVKECRRKGGRYYHIRGTEAHVGQSAQEEERLAQALGAEPDEDGNFSTWMMWKRIGSGKGHLCHFTHHIGATASEFHEGTALSREMVSMFVDAGRWKDEPPQVIVRSHRHRRYKNETDGDGGYFLVVVTPGWQLATPYTFKLATARASQPQFGGILIRVGDEELYTRAFTRRIGRSKER